MATHTQEQFQRIVDSLNQTSNGLMTFQLVGSLTEKPASYNDADIVVYPRLGPFGFEGFLRGIRKSGAEVLEVDKDSVTPFPGRPNGQDRVQVKFTTGQVVDFFFPKGYCDFKRK
jgi:hypothetical protein